MFQKSRRGRPPKVPDVAIRLETFLARQSQGISIRDAAQAIGGSVATTWRAARLLQATGEVRAHPLAGLYHLNRESEVLSDWRSRLPANWGQFLRSPGPERWPDGECTQIFRSAYYAVSRLTSASGGPKLRPDELPIVVEVLAQSLSERSCLGEAEQQYNEMSRRLGDATLRKGLLDRVVHHESRSGS